jgi:cyclopropane fatty-acyl-phospholipid synthase-like methyltransferase
MSNESIADYYDASTARFLLVGGSGRSLAIHRQLWAEGVETTEEASDHINAVVRETAERLLGTAPETLCDLGCGVGGSILYLARAWPATRLVGLTISAAQAQRAAAELRARGLDGRCRVLRADFTRPVDVPPADLALAIESHVHAASARDFLAAARRLLRPGGLLIVVDDMLLRPESDLSPEARRRVAAFRKGWRLGHVPDRAGFAAAGDAEGFDLAEMQDLTALLRLDRLRDRALHVAGPLADRLGLNAWPFFGNMIGGDALTRSYRTGVMGYTLAALRLRDA